jgi:hypothetical protein
MKRKQNALPQAAKSKGENQLLPLRFATWQRVSLFDRISTASLV